MSASSSGRRSGSTGQAPTHATFWLLLLLGPAVVANLVDALDGWGVVGPHTGVLVRGVAAAGALIAFLVARRRGPLTQGLVLLLWGALLGGGVHHLVGATGLPAEVIAAIAGVVLLGVGSLAWSRGRSLALDARYGGGWLVRLPACGAALIVGCCIEEILDATAPVSASRAVVLAFALVSLALVPVTGRARFLAPWAVLVLSRPAGLGLGTWLSDGISAGGVGLGPAVSSGLLLAGIAVSVSHLRLQTGPVRPIPAPRREPALPSVPTPVRRPDLQPVGAPPTD